jgi:hypothetical protein
MVVVACCIILGSLWRMHPKQAGKIFHYHFKSFAFPYTAQNRQQQKEKRLFRFAKQPLLLAYWKCEY